MADGLRDRVGRAVEGLTPGYFALVMATGILSVGMHLERFDILSAVLLGVCCSAFVVLLALTGWRLVAYRSAVVEDFTDPRRGFGFFTFVAGTNVLGVRLGIAGFHEATAVLLVLAGVAWLALGYVVPWTAVLGRQERPVLATANGTWFIWVVASQSVAVAAATIEPVFDSVRRELAVLAIMSWSVGVFLYAAAGLLVALRLMLYEFGGFALKIKFAPVWQREANPGFALAALGAFLVIESRAHADARGAKRIARLSAVLSDRINRKPGDVTASLKRLWGKISARLQPGKVAVFSGASGTAPATAEERAFLAEHKDIAVRATGTYVGHAFEPQFPMNVALAAIAVSRGNLNPPADDSGVERAMQGPLTQVVVTAIGHWRGEGLALVEAP